jgi:ubiquinone/menaquinone biosynthesis C-methylase UbiE
MTISNPSNKFKQQVIHHEEAYSKRLMDRSVEMWLNNDNADYWGNTLPLEELRPLFKNMDQQNILTIGDGKGGKDGVFFQKLGHQVTVSDIAVDVLHEAHSRGIIDEYKQINAEAIDLEDGSYDYLFTKETLHHLPRPYVALYEMLRVAKKGIVLIEPFLAGYEAGQLPPKEYEESGNYLYRFSTYELTMIARAMGLKSVIFGYGRMVHVKGAGTIKGEELTMFKRNTLVELDNLNKKFGKDHKSLLIAILLKDEMTPSLERLTLDAGFNVEHLN